MLISMSYFLAKIIQFKFDFNFSIAVGFFAFLGVVQLFSYFFVTYNLSPKIFSYILLVLIMLAYITPLILKVPLIPSRNDVYQLCFCLMITIVMIFFSAQFTLGESGFDTVYYLSLVGENSISSNFMSMDFYTGTQKARDVLHNYSSFYYVFSSFIRIANRVNYFEISNIPIYIWCAQIMYLYCLTDSIYVILKRFFSKVSFGFFFAFFIILFLNSRYWNISLAFIGNIWKYVIISLILLVTNELLNSRNEKLIYIYGLLSSSLIAVSLSGLFIGIFLAFPLYLMLLRKNYISFIWKFLLCNISLFIYFSLVAESMYGISFLLLLIIYICMLIIIKLILDKNLRKQFVALNYFLAAVLLIFLIVIPVIRQGLTPYNYFFINHSWYDVCNDFFDFKNPINIFINCSWILLTLYMFSKKILKGEKLGDTTIYMLLVILFFMNPITMPTVIEYISNFVYYRAFDVLFNTFTLGFLFAYFYQNIKFSDKVYCLPIICLLFLEINRLSAYEMERSRPSDDFNPLYKITNSEMNMYKVLEEKLSKETHRVRVVTQADSLKAYFYNIEMPFGVPSTRDVIRNAPIEEKQNVSEILNLFIVREFADQKVFLNNLDYKSACPVLRNEDIEYLILRQDQVKEKDGEYVKIWLDIRECMDPIFIDEKYVLLEMRE